MKIASYILLLTVAKPSWAVVESSVDSRSRSQWDPPIVHTAAPEMTEVSLKIQVAMLGEVLTAANSCTLAYSDSALWGAKVNRYA